jgi:acetoin utilization deacetylase AcuC-like enzyme
MALWSRSAGHLALAPQESKVDGAFRIFPPAMPVSPIFVPEAATSAGNALEAFQAASSDLHRVFIIRRSGLHGHWISAFTYASFCK